MEKLSYYNIFNENRQYIRDLIKNDKISVKIIDILKIMDPSSNKKYLMWLIKQYLLYDDVLLFPFLELRNMLDKYNYYIEHDLIDKKDINFFKTIKELDIFLKNSIIKKSNKQLSKESSIIFENEYISLYRPDTNEACRQLVFTVLSDDIDPKWCIIPKNSFEWKSYYYDKKYTIYLLKLKKIPEEYNDPIIKNIGNNKYYKALGIAVDLNGNINHIENKKPGAEERKLSNEEINSIVTKKWGNNVVLKDLLKPYNLENR